MLIVVLELCRHSKSVSWSAVLWWLLHSVYGNPSDWHNLCQLWQCLSEMSLQWFCIHFRGRNFYSISYMYIICLTMFLEYFPGLAENRTEIPGFFWCYDLAQWSHTYSPIYIIFRVGVFWWTDLNLEPRCHLYCN